jgi:DNA polymerase elongation subunit (family B)
MTSRPLTDAADVALYGRDGTPRILDVVPVKARSGPAFVEVYARTPSDEVERSRERLYPFFFLPDAGLLAQAREGVKVRRLKGDAFHRHVAVFDTWDAYWNGLRAAERALTASDAPAESLYRIPSPAQQYLTQTGRTLFKGMDFDDLHRLQLDIEVVGENGFPNASRASDEVIIVALSDNRGWQQTLHSLGSSEADLLRRTIQTVSERDPDVIEGHNIYNFDLSYLRDRCARYHIPFALGRDGSEPRTFDSSMRFAERSVDYTAFEIAGRHVVDTMFQVMSYDVFKRDLPGYGLKVAARYFGFAPEGRTYVEGDQIPHVWRTDPERLIAYAADDVTETERLARHLSGSTFYLTQMLPMLYGQVARVGPAAKIEALFIREYLRRRQSFPRAEWGSQSVGGYTDVFVTGVTGPVVYADVESLYPSIMLNYGVEPAGDALGLFAHLLRRLTDLRFATKADMKRATSPDERSSLDARQSSYKVLINAFYGNLGFGHAAFNDFAEADRVAHVGQDLLRQIMALIRTDGGRVIEVDTDGVLFEPPPSVVGEEAERAYVDSLSSRMPEGINVGFDGRFARMLSYKKKNYVLLGYDGTLKYKGSSLVSRSSERFGRQFIREAVPLVLDEDVSGLHNLYLVYRDRIQSRGWTDASLFARTETLKETLSTYDRLVGEGKRARSASYELARQRAERTGLAPRPGDRVSYYIAGSDARASAHEAARLVDEWDPDAPDENVAFYLRRLDEFARKFEPFFSESDFKLVFSPEDLFGFSAQGIEIVQHERLPETLADETLPF